jgi:hypothetical protein
VNDYVPIDLERIAQSIATAEVVCLFFPMLRKTLVLDLRSTAAEPPIIRVTAMARGPEDRIRQLRRMRPTLPRPSQVALVMWPRRVDSLVRLGVFEQILARVASGGHPAAVRACDEALVELRQIERAELLAVIHGDSYHTVWARRG